jgi:crotonobetainyl-CoA:carnitine CoA-transferase CaiB-like acyl-CoA transferase
LYGGRLFDAVNAGKRSAVLDLKNQRDRAIAQEHVRTADVFIEGFRPGVAARLGLGAEEVRATNPDLVYCSIVGYDISAPEAGAPSHDLIFVARSGLLELPGGWSSQHDDIPRPGLPVADMAGATTAVASILAALFARANGAGGRALVVPIFDAFLPWIALRARPGETSGWDSHLDPANDVYTCGDGMRLGIAAVEDRFWAALCTAAGDALRPFRELGSAARQVRGTEAADALTSLFATRPAAYWHHVLQKAGVPVTLVRSPGLALADPEIICRTEHGYPVPNFGFGPAVKLGPPPVLNRASVEYA